MKHNRNSFMVACALICTATLFLLVSCAKNRNTPFTIQGRLLEKCNGVPLKNQSLRVEYFSKTLSGTEFDSNVGSAKSDDKGYFKILCSSFKGTGEWTLVNEGEWKKRININGNGEKGILNIGNVYTTATFSSNAIITVSGAFTSTDTLFIETPNLNVNNTTDIRYIYPIVSKNYIFNYEFETKDIPPPYTAGQQQNIWWGIGRIESNARQLSKTTTLKYGICDLATPNNTLMVKK